MKLRAKKRNDEWTFHSLQIHLGGMNLGTQSHSHLQFPGAIQGALRQFKHQLFH